MPRLTLRRCGGKREKIIAKYFARIWIENFISDFQGEKENLGEMDRISGDGDFAINLDSALKLCSAALAEIADDAPSADVFGAVSNAFLHTGGTSGPLLGMWLRDVAKALGTSDDPVAALAAGFSAGVETVQRIGGARSGDKTMVDAMLPAAKALRSAADKHLELPQAQTNAAQAAEQGPHGTPENAASMGRATYVGEVSPGTADPGATATGISSRPAEPPG